MIASLAAAGIAGPLIFVMVAVVHSLLRSDHSLVALPISALATGPSGWVQDVNFLICGVLFLAYPIGLHLGVRQTRWGVVGPALLVLSGAGLVLAGVFPAVDASGNLTYDSLGHTVASFIAFLGTGGGFIAMSRRLAGDSSWRSLATYTLGSGIAIVVGNRVRRARGKTRHAVAPMDRLVPVDDGRSVAHLHGRFLPQADACHKGGRCAGLRRCDLPDKALVRPYSPSERPRV